MFIYQYETIFFILCTLLFNTSLILASPDLEKYLENDLELQRLALEVKKAELSSQETSIDNGLSIRLSTGTATFTSQNNSVSVSFSPSVTAALPALSNLKLNVSSSIKITGGQNNSDNTKFSLSADIISGSAIERRLKLMKAERTLLNAKRALQNRALEAEKEFYSQLKTLFTGENDIIQAQKTLYDDTLKFEEIKAKGYSKSSSNYRQAELQVISDKHNVETKIRSLEHNCAVFAAKCGSSFEQGQKVTDFLPNSIQSVEVIDIISLKKENYKKIEEAEWVRSYNSLARKADKNFTLGANAGYTMQNSRTLSSSGKKADTVDAGVSASLYGLSLDAGISVPLEKSSLPIYTLSATIDLNTFRKAKLSAEKKEYSQQQELIELQSASDKYDTSVVEQTQSLNDIRWAKQTNLQTYDMYVQLEKDMNAYFKAGIITESEYLTSYANKELYRIRLLINDIDLIIYNNTTKLLFCRDDEIQ